MMEIKILWAALLAVNTWQDLKKREIFPAVTISAGILAALWKIAADKTNAADLIAALIPGALCLGAGIISRGQMGAGDGILICVAGICLGFFKCFYMVCLALLMAAVCALICSPKGTARNIPFVPVLSAAYIVCELFGSFAGGGL